MEVECLAPPWSTSLRLVLVDEAAPAEPHHRRDLVSSSAFDQARPEEGLHTLSTALNGHGARRS
jgi:hypothetical protein